MCLNIPYRYSAELFRGRFAIPHALHRIFRADLLQQRPHTWNILQYGYGVLGLTTNVKLLSCLTLFSTVEAFDSMDHISNISEIPFCFSLRIFVNVCVQFLCSIISNKDRIPKNCNKTLTDASASFLVAAGCIDRMKLHLKFFSLSGKVQFLNRESSKLATITFEAWCDRDLY